MTIFLEDGVLEQIERGTGGFGGAGGAGGAFQVEAEEEVSREQKLAEEARRRGMRAQDLDCFLQAGVNLEGVPKHPQGRREMLRYLRKHADAPPHWMALTGLYSECEFSGAERRARLRHLHQVTTLLIRRELKCFEADIYKEERTVFWDPVFEVCQALQIAPSKLSRLMKEFNGNSLVQCVDAVRAEQVRKALRAELKGFLAGLVLGDKTGRSLEKQAGRTPVVQEGGTTTPQGASLGADQANKKWAVWAALRKARMWPEHCPNSWAQRLGFATYRRFYRAVLAVFRKTPHQLELELIAELLAETDEQVAGTKQKDFREWSAGEIESELAGIREFGERKVSG